MKFGRIPYNTLSAGDEFGTSTPIDLPWSKEKNVDVFFPPLTIEGERWNKFYPYRLLVVDASKGNAIVGGVSNSLNTTVSSQTGVSYVLEQTGIDGNWVYQFPITPSSISIVDDYAIATTATARGINEEHNGVVFKAISIQGSLGVWAQRPSIGSIPKHGGVLTSLFGNTLESFSALSQQFSKAIGSTNSDKAGPAKTPDLTSYGEEYTGYYQSQYLGQFLERYVLAKKKPENKNWRLVFDIPKENQAFIVTPIKYSSNKDSQSTHEYKYTLSLKAWKRIQLDSVEAMPSAPLDLGTPNILDKINSTLANTRSVLGSAMNLLKAVNSDVTAPLNTLRQLALAVKDLGGLIFTVADMPDAIINAYKSSIKDSLNIGKNAFKRDTTIRANGGGSSVTGVTATSIKSSSMTAKAGNAINEIVAMNKINEGMDDDAIASGALGNDAMYSQELGSLNEVFANPIENFELFNNVELSSLVLTPEQQMAINDELENASLITQDDILSFRRVLLDLALDISNNFGAGDETYAKIYNRPIPKKRIAPMTIEENEVMLAIYDAIQACSILTSTSLFNDAKIENSLEYVGGLANEAGVNFEQYVSKKLVPVPFGLTIEEIAVRYLQDSNQWIEIATLNNLNAPYIDEEGYSYNLLSNASGRQLNVNDVGQRLYVGQKIILSSSNVPMFIRRIVDVEQISDNNYLITFDGEDDLDKLQTIHGARIQGYLAATVNSQDQIYIPTNDASEMDDRIQTPAAFKNDTLTKISKIDWLLTEDGDVAINGVGDIRLANGLNNLIQALKLKIVTEKNTLMRHLDYGLGIKAGISIADIERGDLYRSLETMILQDERFANISRMQVSIEGPKITIDIAVTLANNSGVLPISFSV